MTTERLPLFPLHTVLVPGMVLPLHIFEPRYQVMMEHVLAGERRFGVLLQQGSAGDPEAQPHDVGTVAEVMDVVPLQDGRMNISTTGRWRFHVRAFHHDQPYLTGDVERLAEDYTPSEQLYRLQAEVERLSLRYIRLVLALSNEQVAQVRLPRDPVALSYKVAGLIAAIHLTEAQDLLATPTVEQRLYAGLLLLRRELAILQCMGDMRQTGDHFCPN